MHEMEARLREYKCIELIYKEHTGEFEQEMRKYTTTSGTASIVNCQSLIRQLVSTNVLLKEQLDKQTEDKKVLRKKLFQLEKHHADKERLAALSVQLTSKCNYIFVIFLFFLYTKNIVY